MKDAVAFAYGDSIQCNVQNKHDVPLSDVDLLYMRDEMEAADDNVFLIQLL